MSEIRVGQVWQEKTYNQRVMRVEDIIEHSQGGIFAAKMRLVSGKGRPETTLQAYVLRSGWKMIEEAPDAPLRTIRLPLAKDTTESECGECPCLVADWSTTRPADRCRAFNKLVDYRMGPHGGSEGGHYERLPECVQAEKA